MNGIQTLWDRDNMWWDSTVITDWKKCFKLYPEWKYTADDIEFYHSIQNWIPSIKIFFTHWVDLWLSKPIKEFEVDFLDLDSDIFLASDIKTWDGVLVSDVDYIDWKTLGELINDSNFYQALNYKIAPLLFRIQEYLSNFLKVDLQTNDRYKNHPYLRFQINPYNIKIKELDIENQTAILFVTDICMQIHEFVQKNRLITKNILLSKVVS